MPIVDRTGLQRSSPGTEFYRPNIFTEAGYGLARGTQGLIGSAGDMAMWLGEMQDDPAMVEWGRRHSDYWRRAAMTGRERPRQKIMHGMSEGPFGIPIWRHPFLKSAALVGEAIPSLALGAVGTKAAYAGARGLGLIGDWNKASKLAQFGVAFAGTQPLGAVIGANFYREARDAGVSAPEASRMAMLDWLGQSVLEVIPMMEWMKGGRNVARRFFRVGLTEGAEEVAQGLFENSIKAYGWKGTEKLYEDIVDGLLENFVGGFLSGGLLGMTNPNVIEDISGDLYRKLNRDGVRNKDGSRMSYESVESTVMSVAEKMVANVGDIFAKAENDIRKRAGLLQTEVSPRNDSDLEVIAKFQRQKIRGKDRVKMASETQAPGQARPYTSVLSVDEQRHVNQELDNTLGSLNLDIEKGRPLRLYDNNFPRALRDRLLDMATSDYQAKKQGEPSNLREQILEEFAKEDVYLVGGDGSARTGVFYGPRMLAGEWGYSPMTTAEKVVSGLAQRSLLERDDPNYLDIKDMQFIGTKTLPPGELAKTFWKEINRHPHKVTPPDYLVTENEIDEAIDFLGYSPVVKDALNNVLDLMRDVSGPPLLSAFKDMNVLIRRTGDLKKKIKSLENKEDVELVFGAYFEQEQETIALYADAVQAEFETTNIGGFNTLEEALTHKILHEFTHHLLRVNQTKLLNEYKKEHGKQTLVSEKLLRTIFDNVREMEILDDATFIKFIQYTHSEDFMSYLEEVASEAVAYEHTLKLSSEDALKRAMKTAQYKYYSANTIDSWIAVFNDKTDSTLTRSQVNDMIVSMYDMAATRANKRIQALKDDRIKERLQGAASLKLGTDLDRRRISPERSSHRRAGSYFRNIRQSSLKDVIERVKGSGTGSDRYQFRAPVDLYKALSREVKDSDVKIERAFLPTLGNPAQVDPASIQDWDNGGKLVINVNAEQGWSELSAEQKKFVLNHEIGHAIYTTLPKNIQSQYGLEDFASGYAMWKTGKKVKKSSQNEQAKRAEEVAQWIRKLEQARNISDKVSSASMDEAREVSHGLSPEKKQDLKEAVFGTDPEVKQVFWEASLYKAGAVKQARTKFPTSDITQRINSMKREIINMTHRMRQLLRSKDPKDLQRAVDVEGAIRELNIALDSEYIKYNEVTKTNKESELEALKEEKGYGDKFKFRKALVEEVGNYIKFLNQYLARYSGNPQPNEQVFKTMDTVKAFLQQFQGRDLGGYTYIDEKTGELMAVRVKTQYKYTDDAPLVVQARELIKGLEAVKDAIQAESEADANKLKFKHHMVIKEDVGLFDEDTQQVVWLKGTNRGGEWGHYRVLQLTQDKRKYAIIHGMPEAFAYVDSFGNVQYKDNVKIENTHMFDIDAKFYEPGDEGKPDTPTFWRDLPRSVRNSKYINNVRDAFERAFPGEQKSPTEQLVNPGYKEVREYGMLLKGFIGLVKLGNPMLKDEDIYMTLPDSLRKRFSKKVTLAEKGDIENIIENYLKEKHLGMLSAFNAARITNIITRAVWDRIREKYPTKSEQEQRQLLNTYLQIMTFANQEIIPVRGTDRFMLSDIGMGGAWQPGNIRSPKYAGKKVNTSERDATIEIYRSLKNELGDPLTPQQENVLNVTRPSLLFWHLLDDKVLQDIVFLTKTNVENVIFDEMLDSGILERTDNLANIRRGFTHIMWSHIDADERARSVVKRITDSPNIPRHKYRTATEAVLATGTADFGAGLFPVMNYAAIMGDYVAGGMQKISQLDMIKKLQEIKPVDKNGVPKVKDQHGNAYSLGYIAYETDPEVSKHFKRNTNFLTSLGYKQLHEATGLTVRKGGVWYRPWVHRDIYPLLEKLYKTKSGSDYTQKLLEINGFVKRNIMLSPYSFAIQIASSPMLWLDDKAATWMPTFGKRAFDLGIKPLFWKGKSNQRLPGLLLGGLEEGRRQRRDPNPFSHIDDHIKDGMMDPNLISLFIRHGAKNFNISWVMDSLFDSQMLRKHPLLATEAENLMETIAGKWGIDNHVFNTYVGRIMYSFMSSMTQRFQRENPGMSQDDAARLAVAFANDTSGMIDKHIYGSEGRLLQALLFARDFTMSFLRQITGAAYGLPFITKYMDSVTEMNSLLHGDKSTKDKKFLARYYRAHLFKVIVTKMFLFTLLQFGMSFMDDDDDDKDLLARKRWMFMNEPGKFGMIRTPFKAETGEQIYVDPLLWREASQFISIANRGPTDFALGKMSWATKTFAEQVMNKNYMGQNITNTSGTLNLGTQALDRAAHIGGSVLPTFIRQGGRANVIANVFSSAFGFPLKTGTAAKNPEELLRMRRAASQVEYDDRKTRTKIRKASLKQLRKMLFAREISGTQYRNEVMRRQNPELFHRRRNRSKLRRYRRENR